MEHKNFLSPLIMLAIAIGIVVISVALICVAALTYIRWHYGSLEKLGIPVVKPHFILGSSPDLDVVVGHELDYEWFKTRPAVFV